jgi:hypothetical protein
VESGEADSTATVKPNKELASDSLQNPFDTVTGYSGHKAIGLNILPSAAFRYRKDRPNFRKKALFQLILLLLGLSKSDSDVS